jgi:hypothetical protein
MTGASTAYFDVFFVHPSPIASDDVMQNIVAFSALPLQQTIAPALFCQFRRNPPCASFVKSKNILAFRAVCRQRLGKHVPAATDTHATIEVLLEAGFSAVVRAEELT